MEAQQTDSPSAAQIDPRGDMLKLQGDGEVEPGGLVPPYEGRTETQSSDEPDERIERRKDMSRILNGEEPPLDPSQPTGNTSGPGPEQAPAGVGESSPGTARGEDQSRLHGKEAGRHDEGTEGPTGRPVGSSDERDLTGVNPTRANS